MDEHSRLKVPIFGVVCLIFVAMRLWRLDDACLWFDEIFSVHAAEQDWSSLLSFVAKDLIHPPLYYLILKVWIAIGGESIFWLRLLSVIFAALAMVPFLLLSRELKLERSTILLGLFLLTVNGSLINYTQRVRMYTLLMFLSLFSIWLFSRYYYRGKSLVALAVVNVFLMYTHYYGSLVVGCEIAAILAFQRIKWSGAAVMFGSGTLFFLPWICTVLMSARSGSDVSQNIAWISRPGFREIGVFIIDLLEPFYFQFSTTEPTSIFAISIPLLTVFLAAIVLFVIRAKDLEISHKQHTLFLAGFAFLPILAVFAASWVLPYSVWGIRHLIICAGPLALLMAVVVTRVRDSVLRLSIVSLIVIISAVAFFIQASRPAAAYLWCSWDQIGQKFAAEPEVPQRVYAFESLIAYHVWFATRNAGNTEVFDVEGPDSLIENEVYFLPRGFDGVRKVEPKDISGERAWLLFRTHKIGEETALFNSLREKGYTICPTIPARFGTTNVYKVEIVKEPETCFKAH